MGQFVSHNTTPPAGPSLAQSLRNLQANQPAFTGSGCWGVSTLAPLPNSKPDKTPRSPHTGLPLHVDNPAVWFTFQDCLDAVVAGRFAALGRLFQHGDGYVVVDLDELDPSEKYFAEKRASQIRIYNDLPTYTELSQSGKGAHLICAANYPAGHNRHGLEMYGHARYMICTGNEVPDRAGWPIAPLQSVVDDLGDMFTAARSGGGGEPEWGKVTEASEPLIARARRARNGDKFTDLFDNPLPEDAEGWSDRDASLAQMIAFYTTNPEQMLEIFRQSKQYNPERKARKSGYKSVEKYEQEYLLRLTFGRAVELRNEDIAKQQADLAFGRQLAANLLVKHADDQRVVDTAAATLSEAERAYLRGVSNDRQISWCVDTGREDLLDLATENGSAWHALVSPTLTVAAPSVVQTQAAVSGFAGDPVDLWGVLTPPELPRGVVPKVIEDYAFDIAAMHGTDPGANAMTALAVCAGVIPDSITVRVKQHDDDWRVRCCIWVGLVGPSSAKKSPMLKAASRPITREATAAHKAFAAQLKAWNSDKEAQKSTPAPELSQLIFTDTTAEALAKGLHANKDGGILLDDELSGWLGRMESYSNGNAGTQRSTWLKARDGGSHTVNRVGSGVHFIENLSMALVGGIQPEKVREAVRQSGDGLIQRMLPIITRSADADRDVPSTGGISAYNAMVAQLYGLRRMLDTDGRALPTDHTFSHEASRFREAKVAEWHTLQQGVESTIAPLAQHIGKYPGFLPELALIFHRVTYAGQPNTPIVVPLETIQAAARLMEEYLMPHAVHFYRDTVGVADDADDVEKLALCLLARNKPEIRHRELKEAGFRGMNKFESRKLFERLESLGWVLPGVSGRSDSDLWLINPRAHELFAEKKAAELERRRKARAAIVQLGRTKA